MIGGREDVEDYLLRGFTCFLVNGVPLYALTDDVQVVCDDGDCFGCLERSSGRGEELKPKTLDEMLALDYICTLTR